MSGSSLNHELRKSESEASLIQVADDLEQFFTFVWSFSCVSVWFLTRFNCYFFETYIYFRQNYNLQKMLS